MEIKKSKKADLENKKLIFFEIGLIFALLVLYLLFEWRVDTREAAIFQAVTEEEIVEEIIPITRMMMKPPPPPPPVLTDYIEIVEDDQEIEMELEIEDIEFEEHEDVELKEVYEEGEEYGEYEDDYVFVVVEEAPRFPGGYKALMKWLSNNIKYPQVAQLNMIQGKVFVNFVVNKDGSVCNVTVTRKVDPSLDAEAIRVCRKMPKWKPGKQRQKPVRCSFTLPINFTLK